ncbi:segregation and condensation protein A [Thiogranum longum]|jgi:segregation and condensation protein A
MTETPPPTEHTPEQTEMPFAYVQGEAVTTLPKDLYIPPDALEVFLEAFEGPLDLLLYMIKRQNLDVLDIPIAEITRQYMEYIELMKELRLELAAEYLVMAAMLAEIKSRMLLPRPVEVEDEEDPRAELVRRLQEYERYKQAAEDIDGIPRVGRDVFPVEVQAPEKRVVRKPPEVSLQELLLAAKEAMIRAEMFSHHHVQMEPLSVRERMSMILGAVRGDDFTSFTALFQPEEGRMGVVVALLAVLELIKESLIELVQSEPFAPIYIKAAASVAVSEEGPTEAVAAEREDENAA